jgi:hypothetical protein
VLGRGPRRPVRSASEPRATGWIRGTHRRRPDGEHALLLLRTAVRRDPPGEGRARRRRRAVGGLPVQPGEALPEGRQALPPEQPSRPPAPPARPHRPGLRPHALGRGPRPRGRALPAHPGAPRARCRGRPLRRVAHEREGVSDGEVCAPRRRHAPHRLQRPPLHGRRRRRQPEGVRDRPRREPVGRHRRDRSGSRARLERFGVQPDHHRLHLARPRPGRAPDRGRSAAHAHRAHRRPLPAGAPDGTRPS